MSKQNVVSKHDVGVDTVTTPLRPFFEIMRALRFFRFFFDEATDTDSEDNAGFHLSVHIFRPSAKKGPSTPLARTTNFWLPSFHSLREHTHSSEEVVRRRRRLRS
jgi:hypothetical protein